MKETRKLAAIMFTDIVGYSALMSKDEKVALQILNKNRELQKAALRRFHGEFIKEIGDGVNIASRIQALCLSGAG
ncbi:MAG TPA: adenylate/guanylate cyclase domain-containing protein [Bacteroidales bacterium]|nr:adenylate/guanylate cyclase domain-containing protein [Bacteroidales bacterium]HNS46062.1 adenylate/guanylate cyclase domain-containing protein [Bacteroidales bacterium]